MGLEQKGRPDFSRDRELSLSVFDRNKVSAFIDRNLPAQSKEDQVFDDINKLFIKGEALKQSIGEMNPAGFIPVELEASVVASIQRLYPTNETYQVITFGMFKAACEFIAGQSSNVNEDNILQFDVVDPKIESSTVTSVHKKVNNNGADWISSYLEKLSPWAGMMIAGKMADLSFAISPQLDVNSEGGTGAFKSWGAQGSIVAIALLIELGFTIHEYNKYYKNNNTIPQSIKDTYQALSNSPDKREEILNEAGFDYSALKANQEFNDHKAIKDYSIEWIGRHQSDLNYHHWLIYSQVVDSQVFVQGAASMAPTFSNKWRSLYRLGPDSFSSTDTTVDTVTVEDSALPAILNAGLYTYLGDLSQLTNNSYNQIYQGLSYSLDPQLVCCIVWYIGPIDTTVLRQLSKMLQIAVMGLNFNIRDMMAQIGTGVFSCYINMLCHYLSCILHDICNKFFDTLFKVPSSQLERSIEQCNGIGLLLQGATFGLTFVIDYIADIINNLRAFLVSMSNKQILLSNNIASYRSTLTLSKLLDQLANEIDRTQEFCEVKADFSQDFNDQIAGQTFEFISTSLPKLFPVMKMPEATRRKHFSNIQPIQLSNLGIEVPGTDQNGASVVFTKTKLQACGENTSAIKNIELGKILAGYLRGN